MYASMCGVTLEIPPLVCWLSNLGVVQTQGHCQAGSLTGAVASERVTEACEGTLKLVGHQLSSAKA